MQLNLFGYSISITGLIILTVAAILSYSLYVETTALIETLRENMRHY